MVHSFFFALCHIDCPAATSLLQPPPAELAELVAAMQQAIEELGGRVLPKLSWSCPKVGWAASSACVCVRVITREALSDCCNPFIHALSLPPHRRTPPG